ncbi:hypothetical protein U1Q18_038246 [Sarracenia purpurea var. burkii]
MSLRSHLHPNLIRLGNSIGQFHHRLQKYALLLRETDPSRAEREKKRQSELAAGEEVMAALMQWWLQKVVGRVATSGRGLRRKGNQRRPLTKVVVGYERKYHEKFVPYGNFTIFENRKLCIKKKCKCQ